MTTVLGLFAKPPVPGTVKTRLAADIGNEAAASLYEAFVGDLLQSHTGPADVRILGFGGDEPEVAETWAQTVTGDNFQPWAQPAGDLGQRMYSFFRHALTLGDRAVLIGTDSPNLPPEYIDRAFAMLLDNDVVIGPASDGGYYLIGQRGSARDIFRDTQWSSSRVFEQTANHVRQIGAGLALLPVWYDVDTIDDARILWAHLKATSTTAIPAPRTRKQLHSLFDGNPTLTN